MTTLITAAKETIIKDTGSVLILTSVACGRIYQGHERFSDDPHGRQMIWLRIHSILCPALRR